MSYRMNVSIRVNGMQRTLEVDVRRTLADMIRDDLELTGTHLGCEHGVCGACTVMLDGRAVRSCLTLAVQADDAEVVTVEGLSESDNLGPIQNAMWESHAFQCGFCTPGFLIQATALLRENPSPSEAEVRETLSGNVCRCTGYETIVNGVLLAARSLQETQKKEQ